MFGMFFETQCIYNFILQFDFDSVINKTKWFSLQMFVIAIQSVKRW